VRPASRTKYREGITRNGKPVGNANSGSRQLAVQLAERRILAANGSDVPEPDVLEPPDEHWLIGHEISVMHSPGQEMRAALVEFESREVKFFPLAQGNISIHTLPSPAVFLRSSPALALRDLWR
jgi:hypothetical protein